MHVFMQLSQFATQLAYFWLEFNDDGPKPSPAPELSMGLVGLVAVAGAYGLTRLNKRK